MIAPSAMTRKAARKARALHQARSHETHMEQKDKKTQRRCQAKVTQAAENLAQEVQKESGVQAIKNRSDKLARQLARLVENCAGWETQAAKAEELTKIRYREARVADKGHRHTGHKGPRVARRQRLMV
jgi:ribosome-associated translation inhibitor RaiA